MYRKILCFLGIHKWEYHDCTDGGGNMDFIWSNGIDCKYCGIRK